MSIEKRSERGKGALQTSGRKGIWAEGTIKAGAGGDERVQPWAFSWSEVCSQERAHQEGPKLAQVHRFPLHVGAQGWSRETLREGGFNSAEGVAVAQVTIFHLFILFHKFVSQMPSLGLVLSNTGDSNDQDFPSGSSQTCGEKSCHQ